MDDLISRKALVEKIKSRMASRVRAEDFSPGFARALLDIMDAPAVAAEPVRHGRWVERINHLGHYQYTCSECNDHHAFKTDDKPTARDMHEQYRFCRWCGAKMDAKEDAE